MKEEETIGLVVMVSPVLWTSEHVGKIGTIEFTDFTNDKIWVTFDDEEVDCFSPKTLFILRTCDELNELAEKNRDVLWPPVFENLQTLAGLQASGVDKQLKLAFEMVQDDPELHRLATTRLNEAFDYSPSRKIGR
jgi:hypothetical protein